MRIATWNVNSLKARLEKVTWWLERARPDVLLMQETKLADDDVPADVFRAAGYELAHHGEGRWNGVAVASRVGVSDVVTNFGQPLRPAKTPDVPDDEPLAEARMLSAICGGIRVVAVYAPNGRVVGSPFYAAKLAWYERLARWLAEARDPNEPLVVGGDFNVAPADADVWDPAACHGGTHVSPPERAAFGPLCARGVLSDFRLHRSEPARPVERVMTRIVQSLYSVSSGLTDKDDSLSAMSDHHHGHDHEHEHDDRPGPHDAPLTDVQLRVRALESLLVDKGLVDPKTLDALIDTYETKVGPRNGARVVAKAWVDAALKQRLLADATAASAARGDCG